MFTPALTDFYGFGVFNWLLFSDLAALILVFFFVCVFVCFLFFLLFLSCIVRATWSLPNLVR